MRHTGRLLLGGALAAALAAALVLNGSAAGGEKAAGQTEQTAGQERQFDTDAQRFAYEYESLNNTVREDGVTLWPVDVPEDNPYQYVTAAQAAALAESGTGVLFIGDGSCRICRMIATLIPEALEDDRAQDNPYVQEISYLNPSLIERDGEDCERLQTAVLEPLGAYLEDQDESYTNIYGAPELIAHRAEIEDKSDPDAYKYTVAFYYEGRLLGVIVGTTSHFVDSDTPPAQEDAAEYTESFWKLAGLFGTDLCGYC